LGSSVLGSSVLGSSVLGSSVLGSSVLGMGQVNNANIIFAYNNAILSYQPLILQTSMLFLIYLELTNSSYDVVEKVRILFKVRKSWISLLTIICLLSLAIIFVRGMLLL